VIDHLSPPWVESTGERYRIFALLAACRVRALSNAKGGAGEDANVELRIVPTLEPLKALWSTALHVSGIRLRNMRTKLPPEIKAKPSQ
jgi:hypothetical protein